MHAMKEKKYTADEFFCEIPESNTERYELMNGEITALAAPSILHQEISGEIYSEIRNYIKNNNGKCKPLMSPVDVVLDDSNVFQPDVLVVCDRDKINDGKRCNGAPDFVIEVTSTNRSRDYVDKLPVYKNSGVREYWIADTQCARTLVYNWDRDDSPNIYTFEQEIPVGIFDDELKINISELLK